MSFFHVEPDRLEQFSTLVRQVRADFDALRGSVGDMLEPSGSPRLGTSPVGVALSRKFTDRAGTEDGMARQLQEVITQLEAFIASAENSAALYSAQDRSIADALKVT